MNLLQLGQLTEEEAREYMERIIWADGKFCPFCKSQKVYKHQNKSVRPGLYSCGNCHKQFTVTVGTTMHGSHLGIKTWLMAFHLLCSSKKGMSALQLQRELGIKTYKTALFLVNRIRLSMREQGVLSKLQGIVEVDETYVGGKPRKIHGERNKRGRGTKKTPVVVLIERRGKAVAHPITNITQNNLRSTILENVDRSSTIMTDEFRSYRGIGKFFDGGHETVNHGAKEYARGNVNSNTAESYFAILKRGIYGVYHSVSKKHLHRYVDEFTFRWNYRKATDSERTRAAIFYSTGKRLINK